MPASRSASPTTGAGSTHGARSASSAGSGSSASRPSTSTPRSAGGGGKTELDAAVALLRRRVPEPPTTPRERDRALGILVRKGYDLELAHDALRRHAGADDSWA